MNVTIWVHLRRYCATEHDNGFELSSYSGLELIAASLLGALRFRGSALDESLFDKHQSTPPLSTYISGILRECVVYHLRMLGFCADRLFAHRDSITSSYVTLTMYTRSWLNVAVCKGRVLSQWSTAYSTNSSGCRQLSQLDTVVLVSAGSCLWLLLPILPQPHRPSDLYSQWRPCAIPCLE